MRLAPRMILAFLLVASLIAGPVSAAASSPVIAQAAPAVGTGTLTGTITEAGGGPLAGVTVTAVGPQSRATTTDAVGSYTLSLTPGVYTITATKAGYNPASETDFVILPGAGGTANVALAQATLTSLREIGRVTVSSRRSTFNTTPASVATISSAAVADQGQNQVMRLLDQTPGIVTGHPSSNANSATAAGIQIPNVRGGLAYETSSLVDGHPLSVGRFGNYVITFLNANVLENVELIKGPGANAPQINYAVGGTVNFRTVEPTRARTGYFRQSVDSYSGLQSALRLTGSAGLKNRLGYALVYAINGTPGPITNTPTYLALPTSTTAGKQSIISGTNAAGAPVNGFLGFGSGAAPPAGYAPNPNFPSGVYQQGAPNQAYTNLVACCQPMGTGFTNRSELVKLRYNLSGATTITASYLGSQTLANHDATGFNEVFSEFTPGASYAAAASLPFSPGQLFLANSNVRLPANQQTINNEPMFQAELRTTLGKDTILARAYSASINRLIFNGLNDPTQRVQGQYQVWGTASVTPLAGGAAVTQTFNGQTINYTNGAYSYFRQTELNKLKGLSFEYDKFLSNGDVITLSYDRSKGDYFADTVNGSVTGATQSVAIFPGSTTDYGTLLLRGLFTRGNTNLTLSAFSNTYANHFGVGTTHAFTFADKNYSHLDGRIGLSIRPRSNLALRAAAGSAVVPPYMQLYTVATNSAQDVFNATQNKAALNSITIRGPSNLLPETTFGYNVGGDIRFGDGSVFSADAYTTNLYNTFLQQTFPSGTFVNTALPPGQQTIPVFTQQNVNLSNSRYQGLELALSKDQPFGFGYAIRTSLIKAYSYNLPPGFYNTAAGANTTNLAVIDGLNFQSGGIGGVNGSGFGNQSIPYAQGSAEIHFRQGTYGLVFLGTTYYGKNNSYNVPSFLIWNGTIRGKIGDPRTTYQFSVDNLFNAYPNSFITAYGGVPNVLINGRLGYTNQNTVGPRHTLISITQALGR